jgi:DNA-binding transcriptional ArsR family regulator
VGTVPADEPGTTDWELVDPEWTPADVHELDRAEPLGNFGNATRGSLVRHLREPHTVAELAELLDVPVTRLYHHVKRLEADGLIRTVATRRVGVVTERRYQAVARRFTVSRELVEHAEGPVLGRAIGSLFDVAKSELQREFELGTFSGANVDEHATQSLLELSLTDERRAELVRRIGELIDDFAADEDGRPFRLFIAAFPTTP